SKHLRMLQFRNPGKFMEDFDPETSAREMRKMNRRIYRENRRKNQAYDESGILMENSQDLCDCLDVRCPGCHFPCPKCGSEKCGTECRCNRKWVYEYVEVEVMDADAILTALGAHGRFQWLIFFALTFIYMRGAWPVLAILFIGGDPGHYCKTDTNSSLEISIPKSADGEYEKCSMYDPMDLNSTVKCQDGWTYGEEFDSTIMSDWNLVCDKDYMVDLSSTIYMAGSAAGALFLTPFADVFGRKYIILSFLIIQGAIGFGTAFADDYILFTVLRFFIGLLNMPIALTVYNYIAEMFPASHRSYPAVGINCSWGVGLILLAVFGYFIRDWRILQMVISLPNFITIVYFCFLPESIPWLVSKKKYTEVKKTAKFAAKVNGKTLPDSLFDPQYDSDTEFSEPPHSSDELYGGGDTAQQKKYTILDLFRTPRIRRYTLVMFYLWLADSLSYFGVLFATPQLHGNQFLNLGISGAVEIPSLIICMLAIDWIGRKKPIIFFLLLSGVMNIATIFVPATTESGVDLTPLQITLAMIGKFGITGAYSISYLYSSEIFPTVVRNHAVGLSSFFENLGSITAPLIVYSTSTLRNLPLVVFGVLTIVGGFLALLLPETHRRPLPETIEDVKKMCARKAQQTEDTRL
ncbi:hypothetical protein FSP39_025214, partial [Pinctada imbricata]